MAKELSGWVKIHRKLMDSEGYFAEPFCRNMAWIDIILLANHDNNHFRVRGIRVDVKRGQVGYSLEKLALRWKWSRGKVERFISDLEHDRKIVRQKNNITTLFSIANYAEYQDGDKADGQQTVKQTVKQTDINKNAKNVKNDKKIIQPKKSKSKKILFRESDIFDKLVFVMKLFGTQYQDADVDFYHNAALRWSDSNENKKIDWLATVMGFMDRDRVAGKFQTNKTKVNGTHQQASAGYGKNSKSAGAYELLESIKADYAANGNRKYDDPDEVFRSTDKVAGT